MTEYEFYLNADEKKHTIKININIAKQYGILKYMMNNKLQDFIISDNTDDKYAIPTKYSSLLWYALMTIKHCSSEDDSLVKCVPVINYLKKQDDTCIGSLHNIIQLIKVIFWFGADTPAYKLCIKYIVHILNDVYNEDLQFEDRLKKFRDAFGTINDFEKTKYDSIMNEVKAVIDDD